MRWCTNLLIAATILALAGLASAARNPAQAGKRAAGGKLVGVVTAIDGTNVKVQPKAKPGAAQEEVVVPTDEKTVVTIDGQPGKLADLRQGMKVIVTPATGTAIKIEATTKASRKGGAVGR
jgi:hypothetical protein